MIGKLLAAGVAAVTGWWGIRWWRAKNFSTVLELGHVYGVVLHYSGAGLGGPLSAAQIQSYVDGGGAGKGTLVVLDSATAPAHKLITYLVFVELGSPVGDAASLAAGFPAAFGKLSIVNVNDYGGQTVTSALSKVTTAAA